MNRSNPISTTLLVANPSIIPAFFVFLVSSNVMAGEQGRRGGNVVAGEQGRRGGSLTFVHPDITGCHQPGSSCLQNPAKQLH